MRNRLNVMNRTDLVFYAMNERYLTGYLLKIAKLVALQIGELVNRDKGGMVRDQA